MKLLARISAFIARLQKSFSFLRLQSPSVKRGFLLIGAAIILLGGMGLASSSQQSFSVKDKAPKVADQQKPDKEVLDSATATPEPQNTAPPPSSSAPAKQNTPVRPKKPAAEIVINAPRTTFRIGENSGTITVSTSDGSSVIWSVMAQYPSPIYATDRSSWDAAPSTTFKIGTNLPPSASPGTYKVTIDAFYSGTKPKLPTKVLTITLLPQEAIKIDVSEYLEFYEDTGYTCTSYQIIELVSGVLYGSIQVSASVVSGDPNGLILSVTQPTGYTNICMQLSSDISLGQRTIRATATYNGYTATDDFIIEVVDTPEPPQL